MVCIIVSIIDSIIHSISSIRSSTSGNGPGTCTQSTSASIARSYTIVIIGEATTTG